MAKKGLGSGINAFISNMSLAEDLAEESGEKIRDIKWEEIEPNADQPRKNFDAEKLQLLASSIKEHGIIQPIVVTKINDNRYRIVAGERRWRAAKIAGLNTIKAIVKEYSSETISEIALIENLQREDLNPIEEAEGYKTLIEKYSFTQEKISERIGRSRSAIANSLRLLSLSDTVRRHIADGDITSGHARAALALPDKDKQNELIERVITEELNVRQTEQLVKNLKERAEAAAAPPPVQKTKSALDLEIERIQSKISDNLGTKVKILHGPKKGKIEIEYYGDDDLERLMELLIKE